MSLSVGDIVKVTDFQSYLGQVMENVFFYRITAIPVPFTDLTVDESVCHAFQDAVIPFEVVLQSPALTHTIVRMDNVTNGIDFAETPVNVDGSAGGGALASFDAINIILRRTTGITRNGSKRLGGITEDIANGNDVTIAPTAKTNLQNAFAANLKDFTLPTPVDFAEPVIVGRKVVGTGPHGPIYGLDLTKINPVASAAVTAVSTQRSRKVGHGS